MIPSEFSMPERRNDADEHDALVTALLEICAIAGQAHPDETVAELSARLAKCRQIVDSVRRLTAGRPMLGLHEKGLADAPSGNS
jgi:hypothetical protein